MRTTLLTATASLMTLTACFTGVESTPRIAVPADQARTVTAEDTLLANVKGEPPKLWKKGKRFHITDERFKLLLGATAPADSLAGHEISYTGMRNVPSPTGGSTTELTFIADGNDRELTYTLGIDSSTICSRPHLDIPFAIETSMVKQANEVLGGRTFYVLTSLWRDHLDNLDNRGRKYIAVKIDSVMPGTSVAPLRIDFTDISHGSRGSLFITPSPSARSPRTFANLFAISDPHKRYPDITDDRWQMITLGQITDGMTRRECRLSLGSPKEITRMTNYSILRERWTYENGVWLLFEDDILIEHRL